MQLKHGVPLAWTLLEEMNPEAEAGNICTPHFTIAATTNTTIFASTPNTINIIPVMHAAAAEQKVGIGSPALSHRIIGTSNGLRSHEGR